jgi:hypothetical protein
MQLRLRLFALLLSLGTSALTLPGQAEPEPEATKLTFKGEPLVLPLECWEEDLLRAGLVCNDVTPCSLVMELVAIGELGNTVFVMGNVHADAGTVSSVILSSNDGGNTWTEPLGRIPGGSLEVFRTVDAKHGWIGGQQWEADSSPIPFLLSTRNGGKRWIDRYLWEEDDRNGMVLEFDFEDPRHGFLIIERTNAEVDPFELYETRTGGSSWNIREVTSEEPTIPFDPVQAEDQWRLRSETSGGAYWVEQREDDEWRPVASFAPKVGVCNNMERKGER